jgi:hypothetical protein
MLVDGVLIQAEKLINGATVAQLPRDLLEYWHVELDTHDVILAEGLPAESYLDNGNRNAFINAEEFIEAYPDFKPKHWTDTCAPLILEGLPLQNAREKLIARAQALGYEITHKADLHVVADGKRLESIHLGEARVGFMIPSSAAALELRCRRYIPAHTDPSNTDERALGVRVDRLQIDGSDILLTDEAFFAEGWHSLETDSDGRQFRWSHPRLSLPSGIRLVVVDIGGSGRYWSEPESKVVALFG